MRLAAAAVALALMVAACSGDAGGATTTASPDATVPPTTTATTIAPTTTTTLPPTTTTIAYNSEMDIDADFDLIVATMATCVPIIAQSLDSFVPFEGNEDAAQQVSLCMPSEIFLLPDMTFETSALTIRHEVVRMVTDEVRSYVSDAAHVVRTAFPSLLPALNDKGAGLNENIVSLQADLIDGYDVSAVAFAPVIPVPEPSPFAVTVGFDRGHEAVVVPNWYQTSDNAEVHFTDVRWCSGRRYQVEDDDGNNYGAGCPADLEAEADPTKTARGNGWYFVGDEIAAGTWRSRGRGDGCYWAVYDIDGDIVDNHFGPSTTTMRVRSNAYQVEIDGCGVWLYG